MMLVVTMLATSTLSGNLISAPVEQPRFIISSWSYPDNYGNGIIFLGIQENSTGSWVQVGGAHMYYDDEIYNWTAGVFMKIHCGTAFNNTLVGADNIEDGKNYHRHNVTVINDLGVTVFSQSNFTDYWDSDTSDPIFMYEYAVILDFIPIAGFYDVTVTYELWW
jgi:hypothetical protein